MQNIKVGIIPDKTSGVIKFSQYDVGRMVNIYLIDETGVYTLPSDAEVVIQGTKPSGLGFSVACVTWGTYVTVHSTAVMTDEAGRFPVEVVVKKGSTTIGSANFEMWVERSPHPTGTTDGQAEVIVPALTALIERAETAAEGAIDSAAEAKRQADRAFSGTPEGYSDLVQSVTDIFNVYGAKNLLKNTFAPTTYQSVNITIDDEGGIVMNGTSTANMSFALNENLNLPKARYTISCLTTGSATIDGGAASGGLYAQSVDGTRLVSGIQGGQFIRENTVGRVWLYFLSGITFNNFRIYPMIRMGSVTDSEYKPYALTNQELTPSVMDDPTLNYGTLITNMSFKAGGVATLSLGIDNATIPLSGSSQNLTLCKLPQSYGAKGETYITVHSRATGKTYIGWVNTSGEVRFRLTDALTGDAIRVCGTYLTA